MIDLVSQAYLDNWTTFKQSLIGSPSTPVWDAVVLTAANERQAHAYRLQLAHRVAAGALPARTRWIVAPDAEGVRIGSGGATLGVLRTLLEHLGAPGIEQAPADVLRGKRVLVVHSGGDSKRLPHYSAFGKLFAHVPHELPDGRASTLFDEFVVSLSGLPAHMYEGVVVASGDVLLVFDHMQLHFNGRGVVGVGMLVPAETGTQHGVYVPGAAPHAVRAFLHKPSIEAMVHHGALDADGRVEVDTGIAWMHPDVAAALMELCDPAAPGGDLLAELVQARVSLNFYGDIVGALPPEARREAYLADASDGEATPALQRVRARLWDRLHGAPLTLQTLRPARFVHFGSTLEYRQALIEDRTQYAAAGWKESVGSYIRPDGAAPAHVVSLASVLDGADVRIGAGSVVEDSVLLGRAHLGAGCLAAGLEVGPEDAFTLGPNLAVHVLPVLLPERGEPGFVTRLYGVLDNPKHAASAPGATLLNQPFGLWLTAAGIPPETLWPGLEPADRTLWNARLYAVAPTAAESLALSEWLQEPAAADPELRERWRAAPRLSLEESYKAADLERLLEAATQREDDIFARCFLQAVREGKPSGEAGAALKLAAVSCLRRAAHAETCVLAEADPFVQIRAWKALADAIRRCAPTGNDAALRAEIAEERAFSTLSALIAGGAPLLPAAAAPGAALRRVVVRAPARLDFGGGWSDTPPFSLEHGGTVLNAAIDLRGAYPVKILVEPSTAPGFTLESRDLGVSRTFGPDEELVYNDPSDPLALHKAALVLCGCQQHEQGLRIVTSIDIPKGSGLGASSIMAGALLAALNRCLGRDERLETLIEQVLRLEQMLTTGGGWQDQVGGLVGGCKLIRTEPGLPQAPRWERVPVSRSLADHIALVYTGQRRLAKRILRAIMGQYIARDPQVVAVLSEIQDLARAMAEALRAGDAPEFGRLVARHWEANKTLDPGSTNPFVDELFGALAPYLHGAKLAGAGGGGFAILVLKDPSDTQQINHLLSTAYPEQEVGIWPFDIAEGGLIVE